VVEKNVGESHRNTNLTDDAARCAALVGGLGEDADGGEWAIYPDDMDRQLYTLFRPAVLEAETKYPVITWGNGTCSQPILFEPLLGHLASHGFIVIASNWRWVAGGVEMQRALDFVLAENENPQSMLFGKIAVDRLGASGHSQGSSATITVGAEARIAATVPIQGASASGVGQLKGPTFLIAGETDMTVSPAGIESAFRSANVPAAYGLSLGHDHVMPVMMPAPILGAVTAWFRIHLADDPDARPMFYDPCTLCSDPTWEIETANL
jgi:pimeloyl-ACP methyl ester carboxylesterase